ncbi:hypothetical protein LTR56_018621 [Elasticomyces elasticus]|nr:hypothetical protein LTR56_018621 [Elasticomyces elasticus]KAK3647351.1 hypothetical protein LTR22_013782 [Elasticomyces elasticus]KAK4917631.1 hypothetical protein LTR49_014453 [Elasticomyces elasticus]KAK5752018.1 hypothetical protein LTS12_017868 [Elasticomyces elasticus]
MDIAMSAIRRTTFARLKSEDSSTLHRKLASDPATHDTPEVHIEDDDAEALGIEDTKAMWHPFDGAVLILAVACCIVAICVTLDALLKKTAFGPQMDSGWRAVMLFFLLLPLGLSLAYKQFFNDGTSIIHWKVDEDFGMYPPPRWQHTSDTSLMFNASLPFIQTSWANHSLPDSATAYGFNTLVLNETATAMLDAPAPSFVMDVQSKLQFGETQNVTTNVYAVLSAYNTSVDAHRLETNESDFWSYYVTQAAYRSVVHSDTLNGWSVGRLGNWDVQHDRDQSWMFLAVYPSVSGTHNLTTFIPYARMYSFSRVPCDGTWSITTSGVHLVGGTCHTEPGTVPYDPAYTDVYQCVLTNSYLALFQGYSDILGETLGRLKDTPGEPTSHIWVETTFTTMAASMLWSRIAAVAGPAYPHGNFTYRVPNVGDASNKPCVEVTATPEEAGLRYRRNVTMSSSRLSLRKGGLLYFICAIQPLILLALLVLSRVLYHAPVDRRFGLVALLAGVHLTGLDVLQGAAFSGSLRDRVPLAVEIEDTGLQKGRVRYCVGAYTRNSVDVIRPGWSYS